MSPEASAYSVQFFDPVLVCYVGEETLVDLTLRSSARTYARVTASLPTAMTLAGATAVPAWRFIPQAVLGGAREIVTTTSVSEAVQVEAVMTTLSPYNSASCFLFRTATTTPTSSTRSFAERLSRTGGSF